MKNSILVMVRILGAVAMLSAAVVVVTTTIQQVHRIQILISNKIKITDVVAPPNVVTKAQ